MDATKLAVCHNRRISRHKVFKGVAARGKTSVDWFYGFKLHLVFNDQGERLNMKLRRAILTIASLSQNYWSTYLAR